MAVMVTAVMPLALSDMSGAGYATACAEALAIGALAPSRVVGTRIKMGVSFYVSPTRSAICLAPATRPPAQRRWL